MVKRGWHGDSARHALAARGLKTKGRRKHAGKRASVSTKITIKKGLERDTFMLETRDGRANMLIFDPASFTGVAAAFGWEGWIDPEYAALDDMEVAETLSAKKFLKEHLGDEVEDPGYFWD